MKVLIIRFSSIGDIVLTTPVIRCLKKQKPEIEIHYLTKKVFEAVLVGNPYITQFHFLENELEEVIDDLKKQKFSFLIDLHHNLRSHQITRALQVPAFRVNKKNVGKWILVNFKWNLLPLQSIVARYMETVRPFGIVNDGTGLDYFLPEQTTVGNADIPMSHWAGYVACVIGGSYPTKKFPVEKWIELLEKVSLPAMLIGGSGDRQDGEVIAAAFPIKVYNACGKFDLNESAWLIEKSKVVVSNDTGMMHIAAAFQKPIISLWGNTTPAFGMFPYYGNNDLQTNTAPQSIMMENKALYCHPCTKLGFRRCPEGHFRCMRDLSTDTIAAEIVRLWKGG